MYYLLLQMGDIGKKGLKGWGGYDFYSIIMRRSWPVWVQLWLADSLPFIYRILSISVQSLMISNVVSMFNLGTEVFWVIILHLIQFSYCQSAIYPVWITFFSVLAAHKRFFGLRYWQKVLITLYKHVWMEIKALAANWRVIQC